MNAALANPVLKTRTACAICGGTALETVLDLPKLPLTGLYARPGAGSGPAPADQRLLLCAACGHGQLANVLAPDFVYDGTYSFRTSLSATARAGTQFFLRSLATFAPDRTFACAVDIGCNDLHLLRELDGLARHRAGIDPVWRTMQPDPADAAIHVIGATIESIDVSAVLPSAPDLIVLRHTLEHIDEPAAVIAALAKIAAPDALFVIEVPGFDNLIGRQRFDQVFHQHLHYFSRRSFQRLAAMLGARLIGFTENVHDWGAICVAFDFAASPGKREPIAAPARGDIAAALAGFHAQLHGARAALAALNDGRAFGFGAAQMLPVLDYHLDGVLAERLTAVLDDDPEKDGLQYANMPVRIERPERAGSLDGDTIVLTAIDNAKPILRRLLDVRPRHIVLPLAVI